MIENDGFDTRENDEIKADFKDSDFKTEITQNNNAWMASKEDIDEAYGEVNHNQNNQYDYRNYYTDYNVIPPTKKKKRGLKIAGIVVGAVFTLGIFLFGTYGALVSFGFVEPIVNKNSTNNNTAINSPSINLKDKPANTQTKATEGGKLSTEDVAAKVRASVVGIVTQSKQRGMEATGQGSGIIISTDGYIVTNAHVVNGGDSVKVVLDNGDQHEGTIVAGDSRSDLAIVKINVKNLAAAEFGNSKQCRVGETVVAIGNPGGLQFAGSITLGIISALDRSISSEVGYSMSVIQTDAAINPGNSGGALVNMYGQVVGINSAKIAATEYEGIGFAIPINEAKPIIDELIKNKSIKRAVIGITVQPVDEYDAKMYSLPTGLVVVSVTQNTDAARKGILEYDIITKVDGKETKAIDDMASLLSGKKVGDSVTLTIYRNKENGTSRTFEVKVILGESK